MFRHLVTYLVLFCVLVSFCKLYVFSFFLLRKMNMFLHFKSIYEKDWVPVNNVKTGPVQTTQLVPVNNAKTGPVQTTQFVLVNNVKTGPVQTTQLYLKRYYTQVCVRAQGCRFSCQFCSSRGNWIRFNLHLVNKWLIQYSSHLPYSSFLHKSEQN